MSLNNPLVFEVVPEKCLRNENFELLLGTPINQVAQKKINIYENIPMSINIAAY
jgi:hypothetical protein